MDETTGSGRSRANGSLTPERIFKLLADRHRRSVITHLQTIDGVVTLRDVAHRIATEANEDPRDCKHAVLCALYHWHVPKLAEADVVEFDRDRRQVEPAANFEPVAEFSSRLPAAAEINPDSATRLP